MDQGLGLIREIGLGMGMIFTPIAATDGDGDKVGEAVMGVGTRFPTPTLPHCHP